MTCKECGEDLIVKPSLKTVVKEYSIPFYCKTCGVLKFPYKALNGIVFIWPKPIPEYQGKIYIPERDRGNFKTSIGVVLSSGKGCKNKRTNKFVESELKPGDVVVYDKTIPWSMEVPATDGKEYKVALMSMLDVNAIIIEGDK